MKLVIRDLAAREILAAARYYRDAAGPRFQKGLVDEIGRASASSAYSRLRAESRSVTRKSRAQCPSREVPLPRLLLRRRRRPIRHRAPPRPAAARSVPRTLSGLSLTPRVARHAAAWCRRALSECVHTARFPIVAPRPAISRHPPSHHVGETGSTTRGKSRIRV